MLHVVNNMTIKKHWNYGSSSKKSHVYRSVLTEAMSQSLVDTSSIWIFGYGSLCWNPGFTFEEAYIGYVKGFSRKFWQGSTSHRGTKSQPGRVATLIEDDKAIVWGRAFRVTDDSIAYRYLQKRECSNGGYMPETVMFYPNGDETRPPIPALTFIAYADNHLWLGDAPLLDISSQIVNCKGMAGYNAEYVLKLADFMRRHVPREKDAELFALEVLILDRIQKQKLCLTEMMNGCQAGQELEDEISRVQAAESHRATSNEFANRLPDKKLRCVNI